MTLIMGRPTLDLPDLLRAVGTMDPAELFELEMLPALWAAAIDYGIDPLAMAAQSGHETGWGHFPRLTQPWHRNTCGLKLRDFRPAMALLGIDTSEHPLCHHPFASWEEGAEAQAQHLRAYCQVWVARRTIVDPRYAVVRSLSEGRRPPCVHLADLDQWAGGVGYGQRLEFTAGRLRGA
jgi:hypothetical protein